MSSEMSQHPISCANGSGFPLQIATSAAINKSQQWRVLVEEHPWRSERGDEGYIDIIAMNKFGRPPIEVLVIECKRVRQAGWVFLVPKLPPSNSRQAFIWGSIIENNTWRHYGWEDFPCDPSSPQSEYCAIPGQEQGRKNLLERSASELIESIEALASQEKALKVRNINNDGFIRIYIPVLVTTAKLHVACFDPGTISLEEGMLPKETPTKEVPYVRFCKGLGAFKKHLQATSINDLHGLSQRSVFIINSASLPLFLDEFRSDL